MAVKVFSKDLFATILQSETVFTLGKGKETFKKVLKLEDFQEQDQEIWKSFLSILGLDSSKISNLGEISYKDYAFERFTFPIVAQKEGKLFLNIGVNSGDFTQTQIPLEISKKSRTIELINEKKKIECFFDKGEYPSPKDPNKKIPFPVLVVSGDGNPDVFHVRAQVIQKPEDETKVDKDRVYYDHAAFCSAGSSYNLETILKYIVEPYESKPIGSLSYCFKDLFQQKTFPPKGLIIPIIDIRKGTTGEYGESIMILVDVASHWVCGSEPGLQMPEFTSYGGSSKKGLEPIPFYELGGFWINQNQEAYKKVMSYLNQGLKPTKDSPFLLWIKEQGMKVDNVPKHDVFSGMVPIPFIKASAPEKFLSPATPKKELVGAADF